MLKKYSADNKYSRNPNTYAYSLLTYKDNSKTKSPLNDKAIKVDYSSTNYASITPPRPTPRCIGKSNLRVRSPIIFTRNRSHIRHQQQFTSDPSSMGPNSHRTIHPPHGPSIDNLNPTSMGLLTKGHIDIDIDSISNFYIYIRRNTQR